LRPDDLPPLREVIAAHGLGAVKQLGQNFLLDLNLTGRIARAAGDLRGRTVIEIGPGPGGLTRALLAQGADWVIAVERDARFIAPLAELSAAYGGRLMVIEADALTVDVARLADAKRPGYPARVVANLPYNVATPLLLGWLPQATRFESFTLMFQREVAERLVAAPGTKAYGRLAVAAQWRCAVRLMFDVSPRAFTPPPKVSSTVVEVVPRAQPLAPAEPDALEAVTAAAFNQRRKMLRAALRGIAADPEGLLRDCGIEPTLRAEQLPVEQFCALARAWVERGRR
jgi:16S rRNA (adenine1518-N6/adenine1519-N6)-dimethyltransferase